MGRINFLGSYSGIGMAEIDQLMVAHRQPITKMNNEKELINQKKDAWKDINTRLKSLFDKLEKLKDPKTFQATKSSSTGEDFITMSPGSRAVPGEYKISVKQLATNTSFIGKEIDSDLITNENGKADLDKKLGLEGNFKIKNEDGKEISIDINKDDSLRKVVEKINDGESEGRGKSIGVKATIIDNRIVLTDEKTGNRKISVEGDLADSLGLSDGDSAITLGQSAKFNINGIDVVRDSNNINDVVDGLTINLKKEHESGKYDVVTIDTDDEKIEESIEEFIDQYNSTMNFIREKTKAGDPEVKGSSGILYGDAGLNRLESNLRRIVTDVASRDEDAINDISELGISTRDRFGDLEFDASKLHEMLKEDPNKVTEFFYKKDENGKETGLVAQMNEQIDGYISSKNGIIKNKNESFDKAIRDINDRIDVFSERMDKKEEQYIRMFTALDTAMMQAEGQMSWLAGQVNSMNQN